MPSFAPAQCANGARQRHAEKIDAPLTLTVYPGADAIDTLRRRWRELRLSEGRYMRVAMAWRNAERRLSWRSPADRGY
jgi:hypothetical protein